MAKAAGATTVFGALSNVARAAAVNRRSMFIAVFENPVAATHIRRVASLRGWIVLQQ